jgi:hypothetical protein
MEFLTEEQAAEVLFRELHWFIKITDTYTLVNFFNRAISLPEIPDSAIRLFTSLRDQMIEYNNLPREA